MTPLLILPAALVAPAALAEPVPVVQPVAAVVMAMPGRGPAFRARQLALHADAMALVAAPDGAVQDAAAPDGAMGGDVPVVAVKPAPDAGAPAKRIAIPGERDPLEGFNRAMFAGFEKIDRYVYRPAAIAYRTVVPKPVRKGLHNFLTNLSEPIVFLNDLFQFKFRHAVRTLERFAINTVLGIGGIIDVAKGEGIEHQDNSFGNTLAYYGVGPGPYIFLPILGPSTLRDLFGSAADGAVLPTTIGTPFDRQDYQLSTAAVGGLDQRVEQDSSMKALLDGAVDPYATLRSAYLQDRAAQVRALRGKGDADPLSDPLADPLADPAADPAEGAATDAPAPDAAAPNVAPGADTPNP